MKVFLRNLIPLVVVCLLFCGCIIIPEIGFVVVNNTENRLECNYEQNISKGFQKIVWENNKVLVEPHDSTTIFFSRAELKQLNESDRNNENANIALIMAAYNLSFLSFKCDSCEATISGREPIRGFFQAHEKNYNRIRYVLDNASDLKELNIYNRK